MRTPRLRLAAISGLASALVVALAIVRPHPVGAPPAWTGTEVCWVAAWAVAVASATWLAVVTLVCLGALRTHRSRLARAAASCAPKFVRRCVEVALVATSVVASGAGATPSPAPAVLDQPV